MWKWVIAIIIVLLSGWVILRSNKQMNLAEAEIDYALFELEKGYNDRYGLSSNLAISLKTHANPPADIANEIEKSRQGCIDISLRKAITSEKGPTKFEQSQVLLDSAITVAADSIRSRSDLKGDMNINILLNDLQRNKENITTLAIIYNNGLDDYNAILAKFPNNLFKGIFGYKNRYAIILPEEPKEDQL
jgi:LemA protein